MLDPKTFRCTKCGECCRPRVKVNSQEIVRIKNLGKKDFFEYDEDIKSNVLKQERGICMFLKKKGDEFICSIYENRPKVCRRYPFIGVEEIKDCRPKGWERWMDLKELME